ncbi:hypothetical protein IFM89_035044 [Coptis chinensis]|uniref:FAR1 domain-containing protein n=1 Tax=Coptis chinensis TaxID=261450 RepID=A0A835HDI4_9MAGN|nr:hypothetical protein IFM89_035044 [Coptis chinensis]
MHDDEGINDKELEDTIDVDVGMENEFAQEEKVGDPEIGMVFDTAEGLFEYYTKYGSENGFPIKKRSSSKGDDGVVRWVLFTCSRSGKTESTSRNAFKLHPVTKTQ